METATIHVPGTLPDELVKVKIAEFEAKLRDEAERLRLECDEQDPDEKLLNDSLRLTLRNPKLKGKLTKLDRQLKQKGL